MFIVTDLGSEKSLFNSKEDALKNAREIALRTQGKTVYVAKVVSKARIDVVFEDFEVSPSQDAEREEAKPKAKKAKAETKTTDEAYFQVLDSYLERLAKAETLEQIEDLKNGFYKDQNLTQFSGKFNAKLKEKLIGLENSLTISEELPLKEEAFLNDEVTLIENEQPKPIQLKDVIQELLACLDKSSLENVHNTYTSFHNHPMYLEFYEKQLSQFQNNTLDSSESETVTLVEEEKQPEPVKEMSSKTKARIMFNSCQTVDSLNTTKATLLELHPELENDVFFKSYLSDAYNRIKSISSKIKSPV